MGGPEKGRFLHFAYKTVKVLTAESVEGSALAFQSVDDVQCGDGLSLGMLGVGDGVTNNVLQENLEHSTGFFVDQARDTLDATSASESSDCWLGDTLDVITQNLAMTLCASLSQTFSAFSSSRHSCS